MQRLARPGKGQQAEPEALDSSASAASSCQHGLGPFVPLTFPSSLKYFPCQGGPVFHFQSSQTLCLSQEASMGLEKTSFFQKNCRLQLSLFQFKSGSPSPPPYAYGLSSRVANHKRVYSALKFTLPSVSRAYSLSHTLKTFPPIHSLGRSFNEHILYAKTQR